MFVNRLVVYTCCVFLTFVSANEYEQDVIQVDFDTVVDIIDFDLEDIRDPDQLLAELNKILVENKFIKIWNEVQRAEECDESLTGNLFLVDKYANPAKSSIKQTISRMVYGHFIRALEICSEDLEHKFEIINEGFTKDIRRLMVFVQEFMEQICRSDKFCLNTRFENRQLTGLTKFIHGGELGSMVAINRIRLSHEMLMLTQNCSNPEESKMELVKMLLAYDSKLGPNTQNFLRFLFFCRLYKNKEHLRINHYASMNGEPNRPTPCYEIVDQNQRPRRRVCPREE